MLSFDLSPAPPMEPEREKCLQVLSPEQKKLLNIPLLKPVEVAYILRVTVNTVHRWIHQCLIEFIELPGRHRHGKRVPNYVVVSLLEKGTAQ